jgi:hypothetical protein
MLVCRVSNALVRNWKFHQARNSRFLKERGASDGYGPSTGWIIYNVGRRRGGSSHRQRETMVETMEQRHRQPRNDCHGRIDMRP